MDIIKRLGILQKWYELYNDFIADLDLACDKGCAACCTCNVTCTTLEGLFIYDALAAKGELEGLAAKISTAPEGRFQPATTMNQMVEMCVHDLEIPEETNDPEAGPCQWLESELCPLYAMRPFACRAMCSLENCQNSREALMPPLVLSANNVLMQFIEALDRPGGSGNLTDILHFLSQQKNHSAYVNGTLSQFPAPLKSNLAFQVLMIPPEHRQELGPLVQALQEAAKQMA